MLKKIQECQNSATGSLPHLKDSVINGHVICRLIIHLFIMKNPCLRATSLDIEKCTAGKKGESISSVSFRNHEVGITC